MLLTLHKLFGKGKLSILDFWECVHPKVDLPVTSICIEEQKLALFLAELKSVVSHFPVEYSQTPSRFWLASLVTQFARGPLKQKVVSRSLAF